MPIRNAPRAIEKTSDISRLDELVAEADKGEQQAH
jgi:hypothetical protein